MTAIRSSNLRLQTRNVRKLGPCQAMFLYWKSAHTLELKIRQGPGKSKIKYHTRMKNSRWKELRYKITILNISTITTTRWVTVPLHLYIPATSRFVFETQLVIQRRNLITLWASRSKIAQNYQQAKGPLTLCSKISTTSRRCLANVFRCATFEAASISLYSSASST